MLIKHVIRAAYDVRDAAVSALMFSCLCMYMNPGPIIIRPGLDLCSALLDTEIRVPADQFLMPFPIIGVERPREIVAPHWPSLTVVWKFDRKGVMV